MLISNYHDLVQMGNMLKKDPIHKQIMATDKELRSEEDYDLKRITIQQNVMPRP